MWEQRIHEPFVRAALAIALTAGFGYAALLVGALAFQIPLGAWWSATVQAHGHAQLFGWLGLFILGMGLYFLPKLRGTRLLDVHFALPGFWLILAGLIGRSLAQPALSLVTTSSAATTALRALLVLSALEEFLGLVLLAAMLLTTHRAQGPLPREAPAWPVLPWIAVALAGFALAFLFNLLGTIVQVAEGSLLMPGSWDALVIQLVLYGVAIPMALSFSVRNLPLFMRLAPPPRDELRPLGMVYALGLILRLVPNLAGAVGLGQPFWEPVGALGMILQDMAALIVVWRLDLLRRRAPWTTQRAPNTRPDLDYLRKPTRAAYPDAGEYGRFELLVYSAYLWLVIALVMDLLRAFTSFGLALYVPADAERHSLTVGFITLLIFAMGPRMIPGFSHKRGVANPRLVLVTFLLGNLAAVLRVGPLFLPSSPLVSALLGLSGAVGWLAVAALAANLFPTMRPAEQKAPARVNDGTEK